MDRKPAERFILKRLGDGSMFEGFETVAGKPSVIVTRMPFNAACILCKDTAKKLIDKVHEMTDGPFVVSRCNDVTEYGKPWMSIDGPVY